MYEFLFLIGAWITITPPANLQSDSTSVIICEFSRDDIGSDFLSPYKYEIKEFPYNHDWNPNDPIGKDIPILSVQRIYELDNILADFGTSLIAIVIPRPDYRTNYLIKINNDWPVNFDWHYYSGFYPNLESSPDLFIK